MIHDDDNCPDDPGGELTCSGDTARPNHHAHDSLGCPFACEGDHNHPIAD